MVSKRLKGKSYREAANAAESKREKPEEKKIAKPTAGLVMEVVITSKPSSPNSDAVSSATREVDSDESVSPRPKARRAAKRVLVISDDEDDSVVETNMEDDEATSSKSSKALKKSVPRKRRLVKRGSPSSDYQGSSAEEDTDVEMASNISDDEDMDIPKKKRSNGKAKAIPKPKAKGVANGKTSSSKSEESDATEADDMDMDLDGPATKVAKKTTKRKADNDSERPAKKAKRADTDPWKLSSRPVQRDWTEMQAPPFEIFHFSRKVVDEYTYLDGKIHSLVTSLTAERQWVLSGTPPIHDFGALKTIAAFLDAHLGVDDDGEGTSAEVKKRRREQTGEQMNGPVTEPFSLLILFFAAVERFHSFREVHSLQWHAHRHTVGQVFLDQFVRQVCPHINLIRFNPSLILEMVRTSLRSTRFRGLPRWRTLFCPLPKGQYISNWSTISVLLT